MGKFTCGLGYATSLQISDVQDWLDDNCAGDWDLSLADIDTSGGVTKKVEILFEKPEDRDKFKGLFKEFEQQKLAGGGDDRRGSGGGGGGSGPNDAPSSGMMRPDKKKGLFG